MKLIVHKTEKIQGEATPPASKSQTIRSILLGVLARGTSTLLNPLESQDTKDAVAAARSLGAKVAVKKGSIVVTSAGAPLLKAKNKLHTGNSGVTTHLFMPVMGLRGRGAKPVLFNCGEQMRKRPLTPLTSALKNLGLRISGSVPPFSISGELTGGTTDVAGRMSQYLSALLISLPLAPNDSVVTALDLGEKPYVEMTEALLREQKIRYTHTKTRRGDVYAIKGRQTYRPFKKQVAGDFSSASYLIAAGALFPGTVVLKGLDMNEPQGDKILIEILRDMGAQIQIERNKEIGNRLIIKGGKPLKGIKIDANAIPDLVPTFAVIGTQAKGKTEIVNVGQARIKETDRLRSMTEGLSRLGADITERPDSLVVRQSALCGAKVRGFGDHRTVMALSLAGMLAKGKTEIDTAEAIEKTFPAFVKVMQELGGKLNMR